MRRLVGLLLASCFLIGAAPSRAQQPAATVTAYVDALAHRSYDRAFQLLAIPDQRYFRSIANFASVFRAGAVHIDRFRLIRVRRSGRNAVYLVSEHIAFVDFAAGDTREADADVLYGAVADGQRWRIRDPGHPWRSFASQSSAFQSGLAVQILAVSFFSHRIEVVARFTDRAATGITVLPYARGVLTDDRGGIYHPLVTRDPRLTSRQLFEGIRLAPHSRYTGFIDFATPELNDAPRTFALRIEPALRDGAPRPFSVTVAPITGRT